MATPKRKPQAVENGARFGGETLTFVDANEAIRPLRDQIVVEPMDVVYSKIIHVKQGDRPFRGTIRAVGPGHYPKRYDHPDKHKRSKMWDSTRFQP
ncbi:MAG: hypothetical protein KGL42_17875, partial [Betaproteobacteria bacterium]|nr:hypothetical protein [Betaproteobacteria bacterium]